MFTHHPRIPNSPAKFNLGEPVFFIDPAFEFNPLAGFQRICAAFGQIAAVAVDTSDSRNGDRRRNDGLYFYA